MRYVVWSALIFLCCSCGEEAVDAGHHAADDDGSRLFSLLSSAHTGVKFSNDLSLSEDINPYTYRNYFNGGGVGMADFNADGLVDLYFSGNFVDNKLYLNRGDFRFEDVTESAGVSCVDTWSTGVSIVDINADGRPDIYVCKAGPPASAGLERLRGVRHNELFVNQGDGTFRESAAEYGLDFAGLSVQAAFFDYDLDGDLDCYLLNNSTRSTTGYDLKPGLRDLSDPDGGNKLLRCEGRWKDGKFTATYVDVSEAAGIYSSAIGFGLGVTVGDVDQDGYPDLFVSNDFFERDYLYYNRGDGTFREALTERMPEISLGSMGADFADLTNDGLPELFVTEMLPATDARYKSKASFPNWNKYQLYRDKGYHQQFSRNVLQWNRGGGLFSETGRMAGVEATEWSWGALLFDADGDGRNDIFVANGNGRDLLDQDYINYDGNPDAIRKMLFEEGKSVVELIEKIPTERQLNAVYHNRGDLSFRSSAVDWGLDEPSFSNGAAYGDLDNDGDLDLVVNNIDAPAFVARNNGAQRQWTVQLYQAESANPAAIGARVYRPGKEGVVYRELHPMRGFQSTVDYRLHFAGPGSASDSLLVAWPEGRWEWFPGPGESARTTRLVAGEGRLGSAESVIWKNPSALDVELFSALIPGGKILTHDEEEFIDFHRDGLLFWSVSNEGPALATGDVNGDGRVDLYLGGGKGQAGQLLQQTPNGGFRPLATELMAESVPAEDSEAIFFDADGDGDLDLYVGSGSYEFGGVSTELLDRLYFNLGNGNWERSNQLLPSASRPVVTGCVAAADYDGDGDQDLFVGGRLKPGLYGVPADGYLLINDGTGHFTGKKLPELGLLTSAVWTEWNDQPGPELIIAGEFTPIVVFSFDAKGEVVDRDTFPASSGLWYSLSIIEGEGVPTLIAGNHGLNSRFRATPVSPLQLYVNDFDENGRAEQLLCFTDGGKAFPWSLRDDIVRQLPALRKAYQRYGDYAGKSMEDIFPREVLERSLVRRAEQLASMIYRRSRSGEISCDTLPFAAQLQPVYALTTADVNGDGRSDILLGGNQRIAKPEMGIYAAGFGQVLLNLGEEKWAAPTPTESGWLTPGEIRGIARLGANKWVVARNRQTPLFFNQLIRPTKK